MVPKSCIVCLLKVFSIGSSSEVSPRHNKAQVFSVPACLLLLRDSERDRLLSRLLLGKLNWLNIFQPYVWLVKNPVFSSNQNLSWSIQFCASVLLFGNWPWKKWERLFSVIGEKEPFFFSASSLKPLLKPDPIYKSYLHLATNSITVNIQFHFILQVENVPC